MTNPWSSLQLFTHDWKFYKGDVAEGYRRELDETDWRSIMLPHDWSIEGPFGECYASGTGYLPGGIGWYRKTFTLPSEAAGQDVFIRFDGVYQNSEVWCNAHFIGKRPYGYSSFTYRLTPYLRTDGQPNVLAVRVDHTKFADSRWYTGSGIYRKVFLRITDPVHVKQDGTFVTTPRITDQEATVQIAVTLENTSVTAARMTLRHEIQDAAGRVLGTVESTHDVLANHEYESEQTLTISSPQRWSLETPYLYTLITQIQREGRIVDEYRTPFGIRAARFDADTGFWLNGVNLKIKGVCVHHDAGALGAAVPRKVWKRRLSILKEVGCNAIRMSHNPPDPELLDLCDRMGFLVMDEAFDEWARPKHKWVQGWNTGTPSLDGYAEHFQAWGERDLRDLVLRDRNHPSIILWSIGNEVDYPLDPYSHPIAGDQHDPTRPPAEELAEIARKLVTIVKALDPTRPVTAALAHAPSSNLTGYAAALDVVGYNYQEALYAEDHRRFPGRVLYGSENGKKTDAWRAVADNAYISAQFLWTGIDFLGEARPWPMRTSQAGILDLAGFKNPIFFLIQSRWSATPMVYLTLRGIEGPGRVEETDHNSVRCFSNCESVELWLNDLRLGEQQKADVSDEVLQWSLPADWRGTLKAVGKNNGVAVCTYELPQPGPAVRLVVHPDATVLQADGQDIAHIEVTLLDKDGQVATDADLMVSCELTGPGKILGIESGDPQSHENYQASQHRAYHGRLLIYLQAQTETGEIHLTLTAPGLQPTRVSVQTV